MLPRVSFFAFFLSCVARIVSMPSPCPPTPSPDYQRNSSLQTVAILHPNIGAKMEEFRVIPDLVLDPPVDMCTVGDHLRYSPNAQASRLIFTVLGHLSAQNDR